MRSTLILSLCFAATVALNAQTVASTSSPTVASASSPTAGEQAWLQPVAFEASQFAEPSLKYAPYTRWWWPGNDVTADELKREMQLFHDHHFGGVEIQPMALVMPCKGEGRSARIMSYDTPVFYDNLRVVLSEADRLGLTVDMTDGSGWPSGGAHITEADNNLTLEYGVADVTPVVQKGKKTPSAAPIAIPRAEAGDRPSAKLVAVLAAKAMDASGPTVMLDPTQVRDITADVREDHTIVFTTTEEGWKLIAIWSVADMEKPSLIARPDAGFAMNHFDSTKIFKNYEHYFGERTGLAPYMGKTLRCAFNDSYEFRADRHWADDFLEVFRANRGYSPETLLPANLWYGYNNMYYRMEHPGVQPSFGFGEEDWRLRYDYDMTVSDLLKIHLLDGSRHWMESRGMLHRTQAYGLPMDMMSLAGHASIPEMETMLFGRASEAGYKIISSGAHLYNRPIITCETAVYINRAFLTTPQKLRMTIDKILSSGVNQLIYHGTPYSYFPDGYPKEGWYPFWNSAINVNFSSVISESSPFWAAQDAVNQYAQRAQYVLRSGRPHADVLIYYPFLEFSSATSNPHELLINGELRNEPCHGVGSVENPDTETAWMERIYPLIDELNRRGITWDWINNESLSQAAQVREQGTIDVRGNNYQGLILFDLPYIEEGTAHSLERLAAEGANMLIVGSLPQKQPSFLDWQAADKRTSAAMQHVADNASVKQIAQVSETSLWFDQLRMPMRTAETEESTVTIRQIRRALGEQTFAQFYWNESYEAHAIRVRLDEGMKYAYWMDATDGSITPAAMDNEHCVSRRLEALNTIILYVSAQPLDEALLTQPKAETTPNVLRTYAFETADITIDTLCLTNHKIGDWRSDEQLKYEGREATYTLRFEISKKELKRTQQMVLDLGEVFYTAQVSVNGKDAGTLNWMPYTLDITPYVQKGQNEISIRVTPSKYNEFVQRGKKKDRLFKALKNSELAAEGLAGPVALTVYEKNK